MGQSSTGEQRAHLALYRAWRPQRFSEVVGQEHITRTLRNALTLGRTAHAYLFSGPRGTGKTSVAKILAKAVNCLEPADGEPCGACSPCRSIGAGQDLDVLEIDAASHRGIEEIRDLREKVKYSPAQCRQKVYIIDEVHMLTEPAFNALLKTLEEPPTHALFILATTEPHKIPATILSRCQRFDFHRLSRRAILGRLREVCDQLGVEVEEAALLDLSRFAEGGLRDALSLLDQCLAFAGQRLTGEDLRQLLGVADADLLNALVPALAAGEAAEILRLVDRLDREGKDLRQVVRDLVRFHRDLLFVRVAPEVDEEAVLAGERREDLAGAAETLPPAYLLRILEGLARLDADLRWATQPRLAVEVGLLTLALEQSEQNIAAPVAASGKAAAHRPSSRPAPAPKPPPPASKPPAPAPAPPVPPPSPPVAEAAADAGVAGDVSMEAVRSHWRQVTERVRRERISLYALLEHARPTALNGRRITLRFKSQYGIHMERVASVDNRGFLEQVIRETLGVPLSLHCVLAGETADPAQPLRDEPLPEDSPSSEDSSPSEEVPDAFLRDALSLFGGEIVEMTTEKVSGEE